MDHSLSTDFLLTVTRSRKTLATESVFASWRALTSILYLIETIISFIGMQTALDRGLALDADGVKIGGVIAKIDFDEDMNRFSPIDIVSASDIV